MSLSRGIDGSWRVRLVPLTQVAGAYDEARRPSRSQRLGTGTFACNRCDAPVAIGARPVLPSDLVTCPFCNHRASAREFLSLAAPTRPARVQVRVVHTAGSGGA